MPAIRAYLLVDYRVNAGGYARFISPGSWDATTVLRPARTGPRCTPTQRRICSTIARHVDQEAALKGVAVALSGGGHRAALFGLGVLVYLVDAGKNAEVGSVASVSGGSLTNGYVALACDFSAETPASFSAVAARIAGQIARGTLWATALTKAYVATLVASAAAALVGPWFLPLPLWARGIVFVAALIAVASLAKVRGWVCARAFRRTLLNREGDAVRLRDVHQTVEHVFCAADLHTGEHVYMSGGFVCAYRYGFGGAGDVWLHDAVHASAAYPGGFPARRLPTKRHGFAGGADPHAATARHMALVDGGVYDNMADEWAIGVHDRNERWQRRASSARLHPAAPRPRARRRR